MEELLVVDRQKTDRIVVKPVRSSRELGRVYRLVHDAYLESGYISPQPGSRLIYCPHLDRVPETTVFVAEAGGEIVATSTVTLDGPAGFHLDDEYPDAVDAVRREARRLASSWRLASKALPPYRVGVLLGLIRAMQQLLDANGVQTCLFTLVSDFEPVYRRLLSARLVASTPRRHGCASEKLAVFRCRTVLMRWDLERCSQRWFSDVAGPTEGKQYGDPV